LLIARILQSTILSPTQFRIYTARLVFKYCLFASFISYNQHTRSFMRHVCVTVLEPSIFSKWRFRVNAHNDRPSRGGGCSTIRSPFALSHLSSNCSTAIMLSNFANDLTSGFRTHAFGIACITRNGPRNF